MDGEVPGDASGLPAGVTAGSRLAGYLLEEQVGEGGMAAVFRARDERLDRLVALKVLAPALAEAVKEQGPYLLNVKVTPFECVYPMVPAGAAIQEMVLGPPQPVAVPAK